MKATRQYPAQLPACATTWNLERSPTTRHSKF